MIFSKRIHSIYVLRLFNDCVCVVLMYMSISRLLSRSFLSATIFWSLSTSIKMNSLLYAPAFLLVLIRETGWLDAAEMLCWFCLLQGFLAVPFLRKAPLEYLRQAFDLQRSFDYRWTVNWRFLPESVFNSSAFKGTLLVGHVTTLILFAQYRWLSQDGGILSLFQRRRSTYRPWSARRMAIVLFECNLIGIIFARSLHYQHYSWYYHSVWLLLLLSSRPRLPLLAKVAMAGAIEYAWNVFPSTSPSSAILLLANIGLLLLDRSGLERRSTVAKPQATASDSSVNTIDHDKHHKQ